MSTLTNQQMAAILLGTYFAVFPILGLLHPDVPGNHRGNGWQTSLGWLVLSFYVRCYIAGIALLVALLWTWV